MLGYFWLTWKHFRQVGHHGFKPEFHGFSEYEFAMFREFSFKSSERILDTLENSVRTTNVSHFQISFIYFGRKPKSGPSIL